MKRALLFVAVMIAATMAYANETGDTTVTNNNGNQYYQSAQPSQAKRQTGVTGLNTDLTGTLVTIKGGAPYMKQPSQPQGKEFWPRFDISVGAGYVYKFFTFEGVVEYLQANVKPVDVPAEYYNYILGSARIGVIVPIELTPSVLLIPNVKGQFGGAFYFGSGFTTRFQAGVIGGLDFGFKLGRVGTITLGFVYDYRWFIDRSTNINLGMMSGQIGFMF